MTFRRRDLQPRLAGALRSMPVVVVTGMRQTGKTTLVRRDPAFAGRRYETFDDYTQLDAARTDPHGWLGRAGDVTIDEIQRCPELLPAIKRRVDDRRVPGRFLLTGSANLALLHRVTESLAGRALYLELHPLSRRERSDGTRARPFLLDVIERGEVRTGGEWEPVPWDEVRMGGMPVIAWGEVEEPADWLAGFVQTYLERDVRDLSRVTDLVGFHRFLRLTALRTAQVVRLGELGRDAHIDQETAGRYLRLLEASFVAYPLAPYSGNRTSRLVRTPKVYFADSGLAAYLAGLGTTTALREGPLAGPLLETWVHQNLRAILSAHLRSASLM